MNYLNISSLKRTPLAIILSIVFLLTLSSSVMADLFGSEDLVIQKTDTGEIDWVKGVIRSKGTVSESSPDNTNNSAVKSMKTLRQAKVNAMRNIVETMKSVRVDSGSTIGNYMAGSDYIRKRVHEVVKKAKITEKDELSEGGMEVEIELPLKGLLTETMIQSSSDVELPTGGEELYTGLVIDATGLDLNPALSPKILNEYGKEVFGSSFAKRQALLNKGLVAYSSKVSFAEASGRVADKPLIIRAIRKSGMNGSNVVISAEDAAKVRNPSSNQGWLAECRVIIVTD